MKKKILTKIEILKMQQMYSSYKITKVALADEFGVSARTVGRYLLIDVNGDKPSKKCINKTKKKEKTINENVQYIKIANSTIITVGDDPFTIDKTHANFSKINDELDKDVINSEAIRLMVDLPKSITTLTQGKITIVDGVMTYKEREINDTMSRYVIASMRKGIVPTNVINFIERIQKNTSAQSIKEAFGFIKATNLPIDEDGYLIAYKKISSDYKDIYTGTLDNSIGATVEMERNQVNDDRNKTCSKGLHFCSDSYLSHYGSDNSITVVVKIDPADIVSVPIDYNQAKARCCKYRVLRVIDNDKKLSPLIYTEFDTQ